MVWFDRLAKLSAALLLAGGVLAGGGSAAHAADLDDDYPRPHAGYSKDYWGDTEDEPRYSERYESRCLPRHVVRKRLADAGWYDFGQAEPQGPVVVVDARLDTGRRYRLRIDRCSGEVVAARPLHSARAYARHWRYDRYDDRPHGPRWTDHPRPYRTY